MVEEIARTGHAWFFEAMYIPYDYIDNIYYMNGEDKEVPDFYVGQEFTIRIKGGLGASYPTHLEGYVDIILDSDEQNDTTNSMDFIEENIEKPIIVCNDKELETFGGLTKIRYDNDEVDIYYTSAFLAIKLCIQEIPMTEISDEEIVNIALYDTQNPTDKVIEKFRIYNIDGIEVYEEYAYSTLPSLQDGKYIICYEYFQEIDGVTEFRYLLAGIDKKR